MEIYTLPMLLQLYIYVYVYKRFLLNRDKMNLYNKRIISSSQLEEKIYKYFFFFFLDLDPRGTQQSFLRGRKTKSRSSDGRC